MIEGIEPINLSQIGEPREILPPVKKSDNIFDDILNNAIEALNSVSGTEMTANKLIDDYAAGRAELSDVMVATAKMTIAVQLAVTTITSAVNTFKEITQIPI